VGKSTLINAMLHQKIAAVSPRPQTTRKRQMGILTLDNAQVIFLDTPGIHQPRYRLGIAMNEEALSTLNDCDLIICVIDASQDPDDEDRLLASQLTKLNRPVDTILAVNKTDLIEENELAGRVSEYAGLLPQAYVVPISATLGTGMDTLLQEILARLPENPPYFPEEQLTDLYERELAADLIRESALIILRDEVPHGIAVRIDQFTERGESGAYIEATLFVEKESHKGIVIGQAGGMLKQIGSRARLEIEKMSGRKVYLKLQVKVRKNWRNDVRVLKWFGYEH
jgi:GTP-binding protein Era